MEKIEIALKTLRKEGELPKGEYLSINGETKGHNEGAPCGGACSACGAC